MARRSSPNSGGLDPSIEEVYGPDLVLGDSQDFHDGLGAWRVSAGALTWDSGDGISGSDSTHQAGWVPDAPGDYIELPLVGTFQAGRRYSAVVFITGVFDGMSFGLTGEDEGVFEQGPTFYSADWAPATTTDSASIRFTADETDPVVVLWARVVEIFDPQVIPGAVHVGGVLRAKSITVPEISGLDSLVVDTIVANDSLSLAANAVLTAANVAANVDAFEVPASDAESKINDILTALKAAGLMSGGPS